MTPPPLPPYEKSPWNAWWTLLWAFGLLVIWQLTLGLGMSMFLLLDGSYFESPGDFSALMDRFSELALDGDAIGMSSFLTIFVVCPVCWLLGKVRPHWSGWEYLGVNSVRGWQWPLWAGITYGLGTLFGLLGPSLGLDEMDESMVQMAESTDYAILLILGVAIAAPLVEEFIFRGVVYRGWRASKMGLSGTLVLTSFLWTILHVQYPFPILCFLFVFGIILGLAREWTGNIWIPVWMHFVNNAIASFGMLSAT
ncbi:CPBP family intramembrane metalloprotease [Akkermansiaceae bacterium]|nr:CPBP family intramembrane metalloprotease [Akkermansiaceae bacterium]